MGLSLKGLLSSAVVAVANAVVFTVAARKVGEYMDKRRDNPKRDNK